MIRIDPAKRYVYIKFNDEECMNKVLQDSEGCLEYKHDNGVITQVLIEVAGLGTKRVRIASLPPEVKEIDIRACMSQYGEVEMRLKKHLLSHLNISSNDALITYDGQPQTCYRCNEVGHQGQECPRGKRLAASIHMQSNQTWVDIVSSRIQEHSPDVSAFQTPLPSDNKTKRQNIFIDETSDKKHMSTTHDLHNETDGRSTAQGPKHIQH